MVAVLGVFAFLSLTDFPLPTLSHLLLETFCNLGGQDFA